MAASPAVIEVLLIAHNWFGHLVSDMGGSKNTAGGGMGIPGLFLSLLKELASIPPLNMTPLSEVVSDFYSKDKFDMRTELAIVEHLGKQAIPVILNEAIVRTFYFVRRLITEKQKCEKSPLNKRTRQAGTKRKTSFGGFFHGFFRHNVRPIHHGVWAVLKTRL